MPTVLSSITLFGTADPLAAAGEIETPETSKTMAEMSADARRNSRVFIAKV
jgi:hypothetical protein